MGWTQGQPSSGPIRKMSFHWKIMRARFFMLLSVCDGFYLPGVAPKDYLPGERVELKVNKLTSTKTQCVLLPHERGCLRHFCCQR